MRTNDWKIIISSDTCRLSSPLSSAAAEARRVWQGRAGRAVVGGVFLPAQGGTSMSGWLPTLAELKMPRVENRVGVFLPPNHPAWKTVNRGGADQHSGPD